MSEQKPIHVKPSMYAYWFEDLKKLALRYGYNLVLHGSLNRDMDLIAIPWQEKVKDHEKMVEALSKRIGGSKVMKRTEKGPKGSPLYQGRITYIINIRRGEIVLQPGVKEKSWMDYNYYLDISVTPRPNEGYKKYWKHSRELNKLYADLEAVRKENRELKNKKH